MVAGSGVFGSPDVRTSFAKLHFLGPACVECGTNTRGSLTDGGRYCDTVRRLIAGPAAVYICDECVELCNDIIAGPPRGPSKTASLKELPTERLLERLQPIEDTIQGRGNQLQQVVDILRSREVSWAHIGDALGISRQSAWERFS